MRCRVCQRPLSGRTEIEKRAEGRIQPDGTEKVFGVNMPDGPLSAATGRLEWAEHSKHYWARVKHERRSAGPGAVPPAA